MRNIPILILSIRNMSMNMRVEYPCFFFFIFL